MTGRKRGRKSAAEFGLVVTPLGERRPAPPAELSEVEAETWKSVAATKPADWWRPDTFPLLVSYCRHVEQSRQIDDLIRTFNPEAMKDPGGLDLYDKLLRARDRESRALVSLARAMRLTQQAQMHPRTAGRKSDSTPSVDPPWQMPSGRKAGG